VVRPALYSSAVASSPSVPSSSVGSASETGSSFLLPPGNQLGFSRPSSFKKPNWREVLLGDTVLKLLAGLKPWTATATNRKRDRIVRTEEAMVLEQTWTDTKGDVIVSS
jgi:hypothetical protein